MKVCSSDNGFTILETMVALAILAVGMAGVGLMLLASLTADQYGGRTRGAESLVLQQIENLRQQNTTTTPLANGSAADPTLTFGYTWTVSNYQWLDSGQNSGLKQLDVTVGWPIGGVCTSATPGQCKNTFSVTTYFQPLTQ